MALPQLANQFSALSLAAKVGMGAALLAFVLLIAGGTRSCVSHYKDRQADKAIAEERAKSEEHRARADAAEARARQLEVDAKIASLAVEAAGKNAAEKQAQLKVEDQRAADDAAQAGETVDAVERCRRLCERAKRLKLIAAAADCGCSG
jgi:hypothetical protein